MVVMVVFFPSANDKVSLTFELDWSKSLAFSESCEIIFHSLSRLWMFAVETCHKKVGLYPPSTRKDTFYKVK